MYQARSGQVLRSSNRVSKSTSHLNQWLAGQQQSATRAMRQHPVLEHLTNAPYLDAQLFASSRWFSCSKMLEPS